MFWRCRKENISSSPDIHPYEMALHLLSYEGQIAWQMNVLFIGLNVGIGAMMQDYISKIQENWILVGIFSLIGVIINFAWYGTFRRNNKYYHFRMAQAREAEPKEWRLLKDRGYKFSKGQLIVIDGEGLEPKDRLHKLGPYERLASNKKAIALAIWIFIIGFATLATLAIFSGSKLIKGECNCKTTIQSVNTISK